MDKLRFSDYQGMIDSIKEFSDAIRGCGVSPIDALRWLDEIREAMIRMIEWKKKE